MKSKRGFGQTVNKCRMNLFTLRLGDIEMVIFIWFWMKAYLQVTDPLKFNFMDTLYVRERRRARPTNR